MHPETEFAATYGARKAITFRFGIFTLGLCWALYAVRYLQPRWWPRASLMLSLSLRHVVTLRARRSLMLSLRDSIRRRVCAQWWEFSEPVDTEHRIRVSTAGRPDPAVPPGAVRRSLARTGPWAHRAQHGRVGWRLWRLVRTGRR